MMLSRRLVLALLASATLAACASTSPPEPRKIYLVRHAEKAAGDNPSLTVVGRARAEILASELKNAGLTTIYSTDTRRTRETAAPIARATGLTVLPYDAGNLETFANMLRATPGNILVVGHSNTTPQLVKELGGKPGAPIVEATEYDRLYVLTANGRRFRTEIRRFGE
jgi:2,3-bisphosphoglycerate-dependent phosphoglycerate mutase